MAVSVGLAVGAIFLAGFAIGALISGTFWNRLHNSTIAKWKSSNDDWYQHCLSLIRNSRPK